MKSTKIISFFIDTATTLIHCKLVRFDVRRSRREHWTLRKLLREFLKHFEPKKRQKKLKTDNTSSMKKKWFYSLWIWHIPTAKFVSSGTCFKTSSVTTWQPLRCGRMCIFRCNQAEPNWIPFDKLVLLPDVAILWRTIHRPRLRLQVSRSSLRTRPDPRLGYNDGSTLRSSTDDGTVHYCSAGTVISDVRRSGMLLLPSSEGQLIPDFRYPLRRCRKDRITILKFSKS